MTTIVPNVEGLLVGRQKTVMNNRLVYTRMRQDILSGQLQAGTKLNIAGLANAMNVSAGAVREALAMLEADSFVVSEPRRGYRVVPVSQDDLRHLVAARVEIEKLCIADAIQCGDDVWEGKVVGAFHRLSRQSERDATDGQLLSAGWTVAHADFHHAIVEGCANAWLRRMHTMLYHQSERYRQLSASATVERDVHSEHKSIVDSLLNRDLERTLMLMTRHLQKTADMVLMSPRLQGPVATPFSN